MHEVEILDGVGMRVKAATEMGREDSRLPRHVALRMIRAELEKLLETPTGGEELEEEG